MTPKDSIAVVQQLGKHLLVKSGDLINDLINVSIQLNN
jgi:hypothetical protein